MLQISSGTSKNISRLIRTPLFKLKEARNTKKKMQIFLKQQHQILMKGFRLNYWMMDTDHPIF